MVVIFGVKLLIVDKLNKFIDRLQRYLSIQVVDT